MPNHDPIEQEIVDSLKAFHPVAVSKRYTNADWTKEIKTVFSAIGHKKQYIGFLFYLWIIRYNYSNAFLQRWP